MLLILLVKNRVTGFSAQCLGLCFTFRMRGFPATLDRLARFEAVEAIQFGIAAYQPLQRHADLSPRWCLADVGDCLNEPGQILGQINPDRHEIHVRAQRPDYLQRRPGEFSIPIECGAKARRKNDLVRRFPIRL